MGCSTTSHQQVYRFRIGQYYMLVFPFIVGWFRDSPCYSQIKALIIPFWLFPMQNYPLPKSPYIRVNPMFGHTQKSRRWMPMYGWLRSQYPSSYEWLIHHIPAISPSWCYIFSIDPHQGAVHANTHTHIFIYIIICIQLIVITLMIIITVIITLNDKDNNQQQQESKYQQK